MPRSGESSACLARRPTTASRPTTRGRAAAQKLYYELAVAMGFDWMRVTREIEDLKIEDLCNPANFLDLKDSLLDALLEPAETS